MRTLVIATLLSLAVAVPPAGADSHLCEPDDGPATGTVEVSLNGDGYYVLGSGHVYHESNGVEGVQRGGVSELGEEDCVDSLDPDYVPDAHVL